MLPAPPPRTFQNAILKSLSAECIDRLQLTPVTLEADCCIAGAAEPVRRLFFIEAGSIAISVLLKDGSAIETGIFGAGSIVYAAALLGPREALHRATVRCSGHGFVCSIERGLQEFARGGEFHDLALASLHAQLRQTSQIAACNRLHDVQQRLCRWMLQSQDQAATRPIDVTHEGLAEALGVTRTTVTVSMHLLRTQGFVSYSRGRLRLMDRAALESRACECYEAMRNDFAASVSSQDATASEIPSWPQVPGISPLAFPGSTSPALSEGTAS